MLKFCCVAFRPGLPLTAWLAALLAGPWLTSCATHSGASSPPKPGRGLAEYRRLTVGARDAVADTVKSLNELAQPSERKMHPALDHFDKALGRLEVLSVTARARAETIRARGAAYFEEWKEHLPPTNTPAGKAMADQFTRLEQQFEAVGKASDAARAEFKPFMPALRNLRETLDANPNPGATEASRRELAEATANGRRLGQALNDVLEILDRAATELRATKPPTFTP